MARRESFNFKGDVKRAMASEFGWDDGGHGDASEEGNERILMGMVTARPRCSSMPRAPSWASEHALLVITEEDSSSNHFLQLNGGQKLIEQGSTDKYV